MRNVGIQVVCLAAIVFLTSGLFLIFCLPLLWCLRKFRLLRREIAANVAWQETTENALASEASLIVVTAVANWIGVKNGHLRPSDRFDAELALARWEPWKGVAESFEMDWSPVEDEIASRLACILSGQRYHFRLQGSLGDVIGKAVKTID